MGHLSPKSWHPEDARRFRLETTDKDPPQAPPFPAPTGPTTHPSYLRMLPWGWPQAHDWPSPLQLLQVTEVDVVIQFDHFVYPGNVSHPVI